MHIMQQPQEVVALALPYLDLVAFSLIPLVMFQAFKQSSDGLSETKYPMYATLLANVVNITLNYLLIFGKFGFPQLGIIGAAIGTLVSRFYIGMVPLVAIVKKDQDKELCYKFSVEVNQQENVEEDCWIRIPFFHANVF